VRAALAHDTQTVRRGTCRASALDPYLPLVRDTLAQYPRLRATRLFEMVRARGYTGSVVQLRRILRTIRPAASPTLYRRLTTLMGEEAQVDWGAFGAIRIGHGVRPLSGFVMVLSYSRALFALFTLDQTLESFLRGHVEAFGAFHGVARTLVYDNLRSAVLERAGTAIRFHPRLLELAGHYHFAPRPCTPGRANEKGKIGRQIHYLRQAFFAARTFSGPTIGQHSQTCQPKFPNVFAKCTNLVQGCPVCPVGVQTHALPPFNSEQHRLEEARYAGAS
jgi:transposase